MDQPLHNGKSVAVVEVVAFVSTKVWEGTRQHCLASFLPGAALGAICGCWKPQWQCHVAKQSLGRTVFSCTWFLKTTVVVSVYQSSPWVVLYCGNGVAWHLALCWHVTGQQCLSGHSIDQ